METKKGKTRDHRQVVPGFPDTVPKWPAVWTFTLPFPQLSPGLRLYLPSLLPGLRLLEGLLSGPACLLSLAGDLLANLGQLASQLRDPLKLLLSLEGRNTLL